MLTQECFIHVLKFYNKVERELKSSLHFLSCRIFLKIILIHSNHSLVAQ